MSAFVVASSLWEKVLDLITRIRRNALNIRRTKRELKIREMRQVKSEVAWKHKTNKTKTKIELKNNFQLMITLNPSEKSKNNTFIIILKKLNILNQTKKGHFKKILAQKVKYIDHYMN